MEKRTGRKKLKDKDKANILIPVRVTERENRVLKKIAKITGETYMTRVIRKLIIDAVNKESVNEEMCDRNRPG